ncbi:MAG TPA: hypothetical protein PKV06_00355 [bacterium]|nr:hypothetical protein [bacterium]HNO09404.1 hypothetical protein [bacterium]
MGGGVALILALFFTSCENSNQTASEVKSDKGNLSRQDAHLYLENLSKKIALNGNAGSLSKSLAVTGAPFLAKIAKQGHVAINEVTDVSSVITVENQLHEIRMEVFNPQKAQAMSKSAAVTSGDLYGVYADPIDYYDGSSDHVNFPVQIVSLNNGEYSSREEIWTAPYSADMDQIDDEFNQYISALRENTPYPLYALTIENIEEDPQDGNLNKSAAAGPYLGFEGVYLKVERDGLTDEEFELWWTEPALSGLIHKRDMFNGHHHTDESGANVYFPDVNHKGNWEQLGDEFTTEIRLISLADGIVKALTPWEDDATAGSMKRNSRSSMYNPVIDGVQTGAWADVKVYDDAFNCETNMVDDNVGLHYYVDGFPESKDEDDPYSEGAVYRISAASIANRAPNGVRFETNQALNHKLDDINYRFNYYQD